jgi:hypothetical protein
MWRVSIDPPAPFPEVAATPVLHTIHLAQYVFKAFGLPVDRLDSLGDEALKAAQARTS